MGITLAGMVNLRLPWQRWPFRWLVEVGNASYSMYLLHYIVFYYATVISGAWFHPDWLCEPWRYVALVASCLIACATWRLIELPAINLGNRISKACRG
jgi:peptidoglycan/LPS O-acetylase OafA/YrhL